MGEQAQDEPSTPSGPLPIQRLHESLINRIAAGEVPFQNALYLCPADVL
jgi:DNA mismatch repair protein MLH1